jgi:biopolymer transport protein ExbD
MRIRSRPLAGVKIDMTPMIDIVFQLLVFFALTLKVSLLEGDLAMLPPASTQEGAAIPSTVPPLLVVLHADEHGGLASLELNGRSLSGTDQLHAQIVALLGHDAALAAGTEARLACDEHLAYEHTIAAVTALTGQRLPTGEIQPLVSKVRFVNEAPLGSRK